MTIRVLSGCTPTRTFSTSRAKAGEAMKKLNVIRNSNAEDNVILMLKTLAKFIM
jgi:hypothetical protein